MRNWSLHHHVYIFNLFGTKFHTICQTGKAGQRSIEMGFETIPSYFWTIEGTRQPQLLIPFLGSLRQKHSLECSGMHLSNPNIIWSRPYSLRPLTPVFNKYLYKIPIPIQIYILLYFWIRASLWGKNWNSGLM